MNRINILEQIVSYKKEEISKSKMEKPVSFLEMQPAFQRETYSMKKMLVEPERTGIIAEFKKKSPSKGIINDWSTPEEVTKAYARHGASVISVLTDGPSFGGSEADLQSARFNKLPILRKDFILDPYQIVESRAMGADVILLIAACLSATETKFLAKTAHQYGLEVLLEIHEKKELDHICEDVDVVGINNRDLRTFVVDVENSIHLSKLLPSNILRIAESGIRDVETILMLKSAGFDGFLIGEQFMRATDPAIAFASFVDQLKNKLYENKGLRHDATRSGEETR
jgi:indole-3-glycerol phosphate synthase